MQRFSINNAFTGTLCLAVLRTQRRSPKVTNNEVKDGPSTGTRGYFDYPVGVLTMAELSLRRAYVLTKKKRVM